MKCPSFKGDIYGIHIHCHFKSSLLKFRNLTRIILKTNISIYFKIYSVKIYSLQLFMKTSNHNAQSLLLLPALDTRKVNIKHRNFMHLQIDHKTNHEKNITQNLLEALIDKNNFSIYHLCSMFIEISCK